MAHFDYRDGHLCCEQVDLRKLAAEVGTPAYVYSKAALLESLAGYHRAFKDVPHVVCYSVKANSNLGVLSVLAKAGAGADIVSGGELYRALRDGVSPKKIIFSGVGKSRDEMREALKAEILMFNVESRSELKVLDEVAREMGVRAPIAIRVNPDVDPQTHPYIATGLKTSKFGVPYDEALLAYEEAAKMPGLEIIGADMHIGSQLTKAPGCRRGRAHRRARQGAPRALDRDSHDRRRRRARHPLPRRDAADARGVRDAAAAGA